VIDFRYHLVSLVSVFLALAIGVVLGAGPLRESIGDTLTNQVDALRRDKENLQLAVANRDEQIQRRDAFIAAIGGEVVSEQLGGRSVVVVALPSAGSEAVDALTAQVEAAGASVTGRVTLSPAWTDPEEAAFRRSLAGQLVPYLEERPAAEAGAAGELAAVLAWAVSTPDIALAEEPDADAATVLEGLRGGGLLTVDGDLQERATLVLLASGAPEESAEGDDAAAQEEAAAQWLPVVEALRTASSGTVVAGPLVAGDAGDVLSAVRASDLSDTVSTVDGADTPMGRITSALALREQLSGAVGHYGFGEGATAVLPESAVPEPTS
jgi:hypothetical protein